MPPPEGIGLVCELLSLGLSRKFFLSNGINFFKIYQVIIPNKMDFKILFKIYYGLRLQN